MKNEKNTWVFFFHKHSKFWSISLEDYVDQKPFISQECICLKIWLWESVCQQRTQHTYFLFDETSFCTWDTCCRVNKSPETLSSMCCTQLKELETVLTSNLIALENVCEFNFFFLLSLWALCFCKNFVLMIDMC